MAKGVNTAYACMQVLCHAAEVRIEKVQRSIQCPPSPRGARSPTPRDHLPTVMALWRTALDSGGRSAGPTRRNISDHMGHISHTEVITGGRDWGTWGVPMEGELTTSEARARACDCCTLCCAGVRSGAA